MDESSISAGTYPGLEQEYTDTSKCNEMLFMGRLSRVDKRVDRLLRIWEDVERVNDEWSLSIVGDGDDRTALECIAKELGLKRVTFYGHTTSPNEFYQRASILCLTSQFEGVPLVFGEAQQANSVCLSFDCGAGVGVILAPSGVNGVIVPNGDEKMFVEELIRPIKDTSLRESIAKRAKSNVTKFSLERVGDMYIDIFDNILNR